LSCGLGFVLTFFSEKEVTFFSEKDRKKKTEEKQSSATLAG